MAPAVGIDQAKFEAFLNQVFGDLAACYGGVMVSLGDRLGLYQALDGAGPLTARRGRRAVGLRRALRARVAQQPGRGRLPGVRRREQPRTSCRPSTPPCSPTRTARRCSRPPSTSRPRCGTARSGRSRRSGPARACPGARTTSACSAASARSTATPTRGTLVPQWLPALDGVVERLEAGAKVADVGCGHGHSTVLMAQAFPNSRFHGYDTHAESIAAARTHAAEAGVADRVTFSVADATGYAEDGFDLICFFDALHDMGDPVGAARHARAALADGGTVMLVEPYAADAVEDNAGPDRPAVLLGLDRAVHRPRDLRGRRPRARRPGRRSAARRGVRRGRLRPLRRAAETPFNLVLEARA